MHDYGVNSPYSINTVLSKQLMRIYEETPQLEAILDFNKHQILNFSTLTSREINHRQRGELLL